MTSSSELRRAFLDFFADRQHERVASGPLVPPNDPTLMFANAGMVQFKDVFTGKETRPYRRATTSQKCIRISGKHNDLENVGVTARHHTFFEMLGNFSFGDYFKRDAIAFAWDFYTNVVKLPAERMVFTVFEGQDGFARADEEAAALWKEITGCGDDRIFRCPASENFWQMGETGPCGPCTEVHFYLGDGPVDPRTFGQEPTPDGRGWFELWNLVFMQFDRQADGRMLDLPAPSVDTGAGLERLAVVKQEVLSNYDTDLLRPIVDLASEISGKRYTATQGEDDVSMRVIADHARTAAFLISEGIFPDKEHRAYVLRRVMRRAIRHGHRLGIEERFLHHCTARVVELMGEAYPQLIEHRDLIAQTVEQEEERFRHTLARGMELLDENERWLEREGERTLPGSVAFKLYDTFGFPLDLQEVIGRERGFAIDQEGFDASMAEARARSQGSRVGEAAVAGIYQEIAEAEGASNFVGYEVESASSPIVAIVRGGQRVQAIEAGEEGEILVRETPFYAEKGGQAGDRGVIEVEGGRFEVSDTVTPAGGLHVHRGRCVEGRLDAGASAKLSVEHAARSATRRNHSATHLLHWALRQVLGAGATQKGSLVSSDRLRFDYSGSRPLEQGEIERIEDLVNEAIVANTPIVTDVLPMDEAKERGAIGIFEEKYGDVVRVLTIGPSLELCGGTHAFRTGDLGSFTLLSEGGLAAGVRRIEAATGQLSIAHRRSMQAELGKIGALLKAPASEAGRKVERLVQQQRDLQKEIERLNRELMSGGSRDLATEAREIDGARLLGATIELGDGKALRELADQLRDRLEPAVVLLGTESQGKAILVCSVSSSLTDRFKAGEIVKTAARLVGGGGGGRADFAQAGGSQPEHLGAAVATVYELGGASGGAPGPES